MTTMHYLLTWVDNEEQSPYFIKGCDSAKDFGCEIQFVSNAGSTNAEGYYVETVVLDAPSGENIDQFFDSGILKNASISYKLLSLTERSRLETFTYDGPQVIGTHHLVRSIIDKTYQNRELSKLLAQSKPVYFSYDWTIPEQLDANPLEAKIVSWIDWNFKFASSILFDIVTCAWQLGRGREVRIGDDFKLENGLLGNQLFFRVFDKSELDQYLKKHRIKIFERHHWKQTSTDRFLQSTHLEGIALQDFYQHIKQKSEFNRDLMDEVS